MWIFYVFLLFFPVLSPVSAVAKIKLNLKPGIVMNIPQVSLRERETETERERIIYNEDN